MKPYIFHLKLKELKEIHPEKNFLYFRKGEKLLIFFSKESCSYVSGKRNPPKKKFYISGNRTFRAQKMKKKKKNTLKMFLILKEIKLFNPGLKNSIFF